MSKKHFLLLSLVAACLPCQALAIDYFSREIDFWKPAAEKESIDASATSFPSKAASQAVHDKDSHDNASSFPWDKYLSPKNPEFFKEGDYTPPEPFMEIVRNPTDYNLKQWFAYMDKKNELQARLQERVREYLGREAGRLPEQSRVLIASKMAPVEAAPDVKRYRFRMYFDSTCPHCKKMFGTLQDLQARGFLVEARQVDGGRLGDETSGVSVERASPAELKSKEIQSVPVLLVGDLKSKVVFRLSGYQSVESIFQSLRQGGG